jgi:hypothetical protein
MIAILRIFIWGSGAGGLALAYSRRPAFRPAGLLRRSKDLQHPSTTIHLAIVRVPEQASLDVRNNRIVRSGETAMKYRALAAAIGFVALAAVPAAAQDSPSKPLKLILPFAAGGISDVIGRMLAAEMQKTLGQPIVSENRVGAGSALGTDAVAKAEPDGYTMCFCGNAAITLLP